MDSAILQEMLITVSNGEEFYRIPPEDLDEAREDGFYVPTEQDRTIVSDGRDLFEIPLSDVAEAEADGFRDLLAEERALWAGWQVDASASGPEKDAAEAAVEPPVVVDPPFVEPAAAASEPAMVRGEAGAVPPPVDDLPPLAVEPADRSGDPDADDQSEAQPLVVRWPFGNRERRHKLAVFGMNTLLHAALLFALAMIYIQPEVKERFEIITSLSDSQQETELFEEVTLEQPEEIALDSPTEIVNDLLTDTQDNVEIDLSDVDPSSILPEPEGQQPIPDANPTGHLAGRTQAGRSALVEKYGGNAASETAVALGVKWVVDHQYPNGGWSFDHRVEGCDCQHPGSMKEAHMGATAMALLTLMGAGHSITQGEYADSVTRGLEYLLAHAKPTSEGLDLRGDEDGHGMYVHGLAAIALCEALAMYEMEAQMAAEERERRGDRASAARFERRAQLQITQRLRQAAQGALNFTMSAQDPRGGGWRYQPRQAGDTSAVGWQVMALASGHAAGLSVDPRTIQGVRVFLDSTQGPDGVGYGYETPGQGHGTTAVGLLCRLYTGWEPRHPLLKKNVEFLSGAGPNPNDMYYNYYATQVMFHHGGEPWDKWNAVMRDHLINTQIKDGHAAGSWNPTDHADRAGRLYSTCLATMCLEVYYRHMPLYQKHTLKSGRIGGP